MSLANTYPLEPSQIAYATRPQRSYPYVLTLTLGLVMAAGQASLFLTYLIRIYARALFSPRYATYRSYAYYPSYSDMLSSPAL